MTQQEPWETLSREEKTVLLYRKQCALLRNLLEKGALSEDRYEKSLHDLTEKMGMDKPEGAARKK